MSHQAWYAAVNALFDPFKKFTADDRVIPAAGKDRILGAIHTCPTMGEANKSATGNWKRAHAPQWALAWADRFHAWRRG